MLASLMLCILLDGCLCAFFAAYLIAWAGVSLPGLTGFVSAAYRSPPFRPYFDPPLTPTSCHLTSTTCRSIMELYIALTIFSAA